LAERVGDPGTLALALTARENIDFHSGRGVNVPRLERAITLEQIGANPWGDIGVGRFLRGLQLMATGELDAARGALELLAAEGRGRADAGLADVLVLLADVETRAGNWEQAQELAGEAIELVREVDDRATAECLHTLGLLAGLRGDVPAARALTAEGLRLADLVGNVRVRAKLSAALGLLEVSLGNSAAACSRLGETARLVTKMRLGEPGVIPFVPDLVEALVGLGNLTAAEAATAGLEEQGRRLRRRHALAGALRCRGLIAAARGDLEDAVDLLERARDEAKLIGQPFELGRTALALGIGRRRARQRRRARETLAEAERIFAELGAMLWAEQAHAELARVGGRTSSPTSLTPSEQRIAELVAEGKTNKEVAAILVVTARTVESALTHIYRKLDVRSRTELARRLSSSA
jgi:DNA-binding CsgD family transcriptional regulator